MKKATYISAPKDLSSQLRGLYGRGLRKTTNKRRGLTAKQFGQSLKKAGKVKASTLAKVVSGLPEE